MGPGLPLEFTEEGAVSAGDAAISPRFPSSDPSFQKCGLPESSFHPLIYPSGLELCLTHGRRSITFSMDVCGMNFLLASVTYSFPSFAPELRRPVPLRCLPRPPSQTSAHPRLTPTWIMHCSLRFPQCLALVLTFTRVVLL